MNTKKNVVDISRGGLGIKIGPEELENSAQFWLKNKIFISNRPKCIQVSPNFCQATRQPGPPATLDS